MPAFAPSAGHKGRVPGHLYLIHSAVPRAAASWIRLPASVDALPELTLTVTIVIFAVAEEPAARLRCSLSRAFTPLRLEAAPARRVVLPSSLSLVPKPRRHERERPFPDVGVGPRRL